MASDLVRTRGLTGSDERGGGDQDAALERAVVQHAHRVHRRRLLLHTAKSVSPQTFGHLSPHLDGQKGKGLLRGGNSVAS